MPVVVAEHRADQAVAAQRGHEGDAGDDRRQHQRHGHRGPQQRPAREVDAGQQPGQGSARAAGTATTVIADVSPVSHSASRTASVPSCSRKVPHGVSSTSVDERERPAASRPGPPGTTRTSGGRPRGRRGATSAVTARPEAGVGQHLPAVVGAHQVDERRAEVGIASTGRAWRSGTTSPRRRRRGSSKLCDRGRRRPPRRWRRRGPRRPRRWSPWPARTSRRPRGWPARRRRRCPRAARRRPCRTGPSPRRPRT